MKERYIMSLSCKDEPGLVAAVATRLATIGGNILESQQFNALESGSFFMRIGFDCPALSAEEIESEFRPLISRYAMDWTLRDTNVRRKVLLLVSKFDHCLGDLLYRQRIGELEFGLRHRLTPCFAGGHFSARISAKVSFAVSSASRISGTPT